jgi:acyl-CoA thioesterase-1
MQQFTRRTVSAGLGVGLGFSGRAAAQTARPVVTLLGDSIVAGYGLPPAYGIPAALGEELAALGLDADVRNAGVAGDTSPSGRNRVKSYVVKATAVCVVEFGGNDRRAGYPPWLTRENIDGIVKDLKARRVSVVLMGMKVPDTAADALAFNAIFPDVAKANGVPLLANYMEGVTRQLDGAHPDAAGARLIAARLAPLVAGALKARALIPT